MLDAVLFRLVPAWTSLFFHTKNASTQRTAIQHQHQYQYHQQQSESQLASLILQQSSAYDKDGVQDLGEIAQLLNTNTDPNNSPDVCWLASPSRERLFADVYPTEEAISACTYAELRHLIIRLSAQLVAPANLTHSEYVSFCFQFFRVDDPRRIGETAIENATQQRTFFLLLLSSLRTRLLQLSNPQKLAKLVQSLLQSGIQHLLHFLTDGFAEPPTKVRVKQLSHSQVLDFLNRTRRPALQTRERELVFRLERYINATKLDLMHILDLSEDNLARYFDSMSLGLQTASIIGSGPAEVLMHNGRILRPTGKNQRVDNGTGTGTGDGDESDDSTDDPEQQQSVNWKHILYPEPHDKLLQITEITAADEDISPSQRTTKNLFNALLLLMTLRSAFLDDDGSVHQKWWHVVRSDGRNCEGFENAMEHAEFVDSRIWLHAFEKTHENLGELFASLSGKHVLSIISLLMSGSNRPMRMILQQWPALKVARRNEHFTTFPNGILNTSSGEFIALGHPQRLLPAELATAKYFRGMHFPSTTLNLILAANEDGEEHREAEMPESARRATLNTHRIPYLLPFKGLRIILETQGYTRVEIGNILAMMGRTRHPLRELDQFDVMNVIYGTAGTGKSTAMEMLKKIFDRGDLGFMQNRLEREFGLESFYKKKLVVGPDLNQHFTLDQAMLHSMIVGEGVTICRKDKRALSVLWAAHLWWSVNVFSEKFQDSDFSLARRLFTTLFNVILTEKCPNMLVDFDKFEIPIFLYLIVWHYHELLLQKPGASIWDICEPKFLEIRKRLLSQLNKLEGFLRSTRLVRSALVSIKLDLAGMKIEDEYSYKKEHLALLDACYEIPPDSSQVFIRFPDKSLVEARNEPVIGTDEFWDAFKSYHGKKKLQIKEDMYRGLFSRYGIVEVKSLPGFHKGAFVGVRLLG